MSCMAVLIEMISNWVTRSVVENGRLMVVDSKWELCSSFTYIMTSLLQHLMNVIKYTALDELHENYPCLVIDVVPGSVKEGLIFTKMHKCHLFVSYLEFPGNVAVVLFTLPLIRMYISLGG